MGSALVADELGSVLKDAGRTGLTTVLPSGRPLSLRPDISYSQIFGVPSRVPKCPNSSALSNARDGIQLDRVVT